MKSNSYSYDFLPDILEGNSNQSSQHIHENSDFKIGVELFERFNINKQKIENLIQIPDDKIIKINNLNKKLLAINPTRVEKILLKTKHNDGYFSAICTLIFLVFSLLFCLYFTSQGLMFPLSLILSFLFSVLYFYINGIYLKYKFSKYFTNEAHDFTIAEFLFIHKKEFSLDTEQLNSLLDDCNNKKIDLVEIMKIYNEFY